MSKLKIGYVPEHFSSPLLQLARMHPDSYELIPQPSGTGQLISSMKDGTIDVAVALTEALIAGICKGATHYQLVGQYVKTPLTWAVITGKNSRYEKISDLRGTKIGISRIGSGSQVMASVMALQQEWFSDTENKVIEKLDFQVNDTFKNLRDSVNEGTTSCFMWEWFTTKPYRDSDEVKFIGSVPTPWPSWMIAATPNASSSQLSSFLEQLSQAVQEFDRPESRQGSNIDFIIKEFGYDRQDVQSWLTTVAYPERCGEVSEGVVKKVLDTLETADVIEKRGEGWKVDQFVRSEVAQIVE